MTSSKNGHEVVIQLSPQRIQTDQMILELLHISVLNGKTAYATSELDHAELLKYYSKLPAQARDLLLQFNKQGISLIKSNIQKQFGLQRAGIPFESYFKNALGRKLHELLEGIKPFAQMVKWFHKLDSKKDRFRTAPCTFSTYKPNLQFEVTRNENALQLETMILLNGVAFPLKQFNVYGFLLESRGEYFLLSFKDHQTLEWLQNNNLQQYSNSPSEFASQILGVLEKDYPVNRNNLLAKTPVNSVPQNRVMLSEISQSFLVLTPQWLYDGFLVDGTWKEFYETTRNGETYLIKRDIEAESAFLKMIVSLHPNFSKQLNGYYYLTFADARKKQWFLKVYHKLLDLNIQLAGMDMLHHFRYSPEKISTEVIIKQAEKNTIFLNMQVCFGKEEVPLPELKKMLLSGQRSVVLKDGSLGVLTEEWIQQYGTILRHAKISNNEVQVPRWLAFSEQGTAKETEVLKPVIDTGWWHKWQRWQQDEHEIFPSPSAVQAELRPYQRKGFEWLALLAEAGAGACLADDMGLGKTLQTICFLAHQLQQRPFVQHLIICPSSLIYNWQQELQKFTPKISTLVYHGASRNLAEIETSACQVIITSYGTLRSDIEKMSALSFGTVVLDESHTIKNPAARITLAVAQLNAAMRIALSGTPVMNNTFDLYAQLNFLVPGMLGSREFFTREYADPIDRDHDTVKTMALKKLTAPFMLRRTKQQVAYDLPSKTETVMWCSMKPAQKMLYEEIKTNIRDSVFLNIKNDGLNKSKLAILQGMMKLRQICNSPLLLPVQEQSCTDSVKTNLLIDELNNNLKAHKVLVFSQFTGMLHLLASAFREHNISYYHFDGQTPPVKRAEMVDCFQRKEDTTHVFLISLKAGNSGLNLTEADYVFLFDPWWNTAAEQQAIDRTHRIGQTKNVFAYKMVCKDTIEEKIIQIQERKKKVADDLVSEDEGFVKSLTREDIEYLFS